ncbi:MAG: branched-chain amino acid ABC transporter permease [Candidatus Bathyarchaeia archaeon]
MSFFIPLEVIFMGIFVGAVYGLTGIGLSLVFSGIRNVVNLAHGVFAILAAYLALTMSTALRLDPLFSTVAVVPIIFLFGFAIQYIMMNRVVFRQPTICMIILVGIGSIIENSMLLYWNPDPRSLAPYSSFALKSFDLIIVRLPLIYLIAFCISVAATVMLYFFLKFTYTGLAIRASSEDPTYSECLGVDTKRIYAYCFAIGVAVAALAGIAIGAIYTFVPSSGMAYTIMSFGVIVLGGLGSMRGALTGGIILGIIQQLTAFYLGVAYQYFVGYIVIILLLTLRPEGIFGQRV